MVIIKITVTRFSQLCITVAKSIIYNIESTNNAGELRSKCTETAINIKFLNHYLLLDYKVRYNKFVTYLEPWQSQIPPCFSNVCKIWSRHEYWDVDWKIQNIDSSWTHYETYLAQQDTLIRKSTQQAKIAQL